MNDTALLKDRLAFFLGVNTGFVTNGLPDERLIEFYKLRSSTNLHCAIVGNVVIPGGYGSNTFTPTLTLHKNWTQVAKSIKDSGSIPGIQLATTWPDYEGQKKFVAANSSGVILQSRKLVQELKLEFIDQILDNFFSGAKIAVDLGFRHIQIHAAHGYLLNLLIDDRFNLRADYTRERLAELALWLNSQHVESSIRCTIRTGDFEFDNFGSESNIDKISSLPFDFIDLSSGFYNIDKRLIYPSRTDTLLCRHKESLNIVMRHPGREFIVSGKIRNEISQFPSNASLGVCRDLIANPNFLTNTENGCKNRNKCHYYSRGKTNITCPQWNVKIKEK